MPEEAAQGEAVFYEAAKAVNLFGVAERFEAVVSVAMTMGYFALLSLLLSCAGAMAEEFHQGWRRIGVLGAAAISTIIVAIIGAIEGELLLILCGILWIAVPLIQGTLGKTKKPRKK